VAGLSAEAIPEIGAIRLVLNTSDWTDKPYQGQVLRSLVPPTDPDWSLNLIKVRVRPTWVQDDIRFNSAQYGYPWEYVGTPDVWYDCEAPLDVPVYYTIELVGGDYTFVSALSYSQKIANTSFDTNITGWNADAGATLSRETVAPLFGTGSLRIAVVGTPTFTGARPSVRYPVVAGHMYNVSAWLRASSATGQARVAVDWYTAGNAYVTTTYCPQTTLGANITTRRQLFAEPPATATQADPRIVWDTPPSGGVLLVDRVRMIDMGNAEVEAGATSTTLTTTYAGWLSNPVMPAEDIPLILLPGDECETEVPHTGVIFAAHNADTRASVGTRYDVVDDAFPAVVTGRRKAPTSTLTLTTLAATDTDRVHSLLAPGSVLMLRVIDDFHLPSRYLDIDTVTTTPLSPNLRLPYRVIDLPYASAGAPPDPIAGVLGTRFQDLNRYTTWTALDAAQLTTTDLLLGAGSLVGVGTL
jgi:hypothetical protein